MRTTFQTVVFIVLASLLTGCSGAWLVNYDEPIDPSVSRNWRVVSVDVVVPDTLTVSNADTLAPEADIVWHGDPDGDRRAQVATIIETGVAQGARGLRGGMPVHFLIVLEHFHGVTPRATRIAPSAVHNIRYTIRVFDNRNGRELTNAVHIDADLEALLGEQLVAYRAAGGSEKARIIAQIAEVTAGWLGLGEDPRRTFGGLGR